MPLVTMAELLEHGKKNGYGVGAFNVANMEMILGATRAAEELKSPIILQIAQIRLPYSPLEIIGPAMLAAARSASVPIAVHLDHGMDLETVQKALDMGFTSVMMDASHLALQENIRMVSKVRELADRYGASLEAEVGRLLVNETGERVADAGYTRPEELRLLFEATRADAIALSIGNSHGKYQQAPELHFEILAETKKLVDIPLVLHGGSGISDEDFQRCIQGGIHKINVATATFTSVERSARAYCETEDSNFFTLSRAMVLGVSDCVKKHILVFGSQNQG